MNIINGANGIVPNNGLSVTDAATGSSNLKPAAREGATAKKVAKEFEAMFVGMMFKSMRETVGKDKLTGGGQGEEVFHSMLDQEYAKAMTERGGVGLASMLEQQISKSVSGGYPKQGVSNNGTTTQNAKSEVIYENQQ